MEGKVTKNHNPLAVLLLLYYPFPPHYSFLPQDKKHFRAKAIHTLSCPKALRFQMSKWVPNLGYY